MTDRNLTTAVLLALLATSACQTAAPCAPTTVVVAAKERRTSVRLEPGAIRTTETGAVRETPRDAFVPEYWLKDAEGQWIRVSEATWRSVEVGGRAEVCPPR